MSIDQAFAHLSTLLYPTMTPSPDVLMNTLLAWCFELSQRLQKLGCSFLAHSKLNWNVHLRSPFVPHVDLRTALKLLNAWHLRILLTLVVPHLFIHANANANTYPEHPVHVITPFPAGGAADVVLRLVTQKLSESLGAPFVVENKAGAGGGIGSLLVAKAEPDGYTLLLTSSSAMSINPLLAEKALYNPLSDFTPIVLIGSSPNVLVVNTKEPINTLSDLIALAKAKPNALSFASNGAGTLSHLTGELFNQYAGVNMLHVPYKGAAPAVADTIGGQVNALFAAYASVNGMVKAGKLKMIGVTSLKRMEITPEVPTLNESGLKGFESNQWWGLYGPPRLSTSVVQLLNSEMNKVLSNKDNKKRFAEESIELMGGTPAQLTQYLKTDYAKWEKVIKNANIKNQ